MEERIPTSIACSASRSSLTEGSRPEMDSSWTSFMRPTPVPISFLTLPARRFAAPLSESVSHDTRTSSISVMTYVSRSFDLTSVSIPMASSSFISLASILSSSRLTCSPRRILSASSSGRRCTMIDLKLFPSAPLGLRLRFWPRPASCSGTAGSSDSRGGVRDGSASRSDAAGSSNGRGGVTRPVGAKLLGWFVGLRAGTDTGAAAVVSVLRRHGAALTTWKDAAGGFSSTA